MEQVQDTLDSYVAEVEKRKSELRAEILALPPYRCPKEIRPRYVDVKNERDPNMYFWRKEAVNDEGLELYDLIDLKGWVVRTLALHGQVIN
jgi:hypothetical protein